MSHTWLTICSQLKHKVDKYVGRLNIAYAVLFTKTSNGTSYRKYK